MGKPPIPPFPFAPFPTSEIPPLFSVYPFPSAVILQRPFPCSAISNDPWQFFFHGALCQRSFC